MTMLASSLVWRAATALIVYLALAFACSLLNYNTEFQWALGLTAGALALVLAVLAQHPNARGDRVSGRGNSPARGVDY